MSPTPEDLSTVKDDMIAFIEGHGMSRFHGYVGIADLRLRGSEVADLRACQTDGVVQLVLSLTDSGLCRSQFFDGLSQGHYSLLPTRGSADIHGSAG